MIENLTTDLGENRKHKPAPAETYSKQTQGTAHQWFRSVQMTLKGSTTSLKGGKKKNIPSDAATLSSEEVAEESWAGWERVSGKRSIILEKNIIIGELLEKGINNL